MSNEPARADAVANRHLRPEPHGLLGDMGASPCGFEPFNDRIRALLTVPHGTTERVCPHCVNGEGIDDRRGCGCPTLSNGDIRCHHCGEMVNERCWNCKTLRGDGWCPNAPEARTFTRETHPGLYAALADVPVNPVGFVLPDMRDRAERTAADGVSPARMDGTDLYGFVMPDFDSIVSKPVTEMPPTINADTIREAMTKMLAAQYEPIGLVLHPLDHATAGIDPAKPATVEHAKRVADAFEVPYWAIGIPGYRPPLRVRMRARLSRFLRALRDSPGRLPYVTRFEATERGMWGSERRPEPRTGWDRYYDGTMPEGRRWVRIGRWAVGTYDPDSYWIGD